jgi:hypothetical protein
MGFYQESLGPSHWEYSSRHSAPQTHTPDVGVTGQWKAEGMLPLLRPILLWMLLGVLIVGALRWSGLSSRRQAAQASGPTIIKLPVNFTNRTFDPATPPSNMPPLNPWEGAECDSNFRSNASIGGQTRQADATHGTLTVTQIKVTLQLNITIWVPAGASQHVIEHEAGHRQISESYYQTADQLAERIASSYMGKQIEIEGADLNAESGKALQQMAAEINDEYERELDPEPTQLLYEAITNHGRNEVVARDAAAHAIKNIRIESTQPASQ